MRTERSTLIILTPGFPENEADTTCLPFIQNIISALNKHYTSLNIEILAFDYPFKKSIYQWRNTTVHSFNGSHKKKLLKLFKWMEVWKKLNVLTRNKKVIGLLSFWTGECALVGSKYAGIKKLQHFSWILGQDAKKENIYIRRFRPLSENLIAISDRIQQDFKKNHGIQPKHIIPVGIDSSLFSNKQPLRDIDIMAAGSLIPLKQYDILIDILQELKKSIPDIKVLLAGKGPELERLTALINKYGLQQHINIAGELSHTDTLYSMQRSKVFLHTSNFEGFSTVCLEALYAGCHVISFRRAMDTDITNWDIVENAEDMLQKTLSLLKGGTLKNTSIKCFSIEDTAIQLMDLYNYNEAANDSNFLAIASKESCF